MPDIRIHKFESNRFVTKKIVEENIQNGDKVSSTHIDNVSNTKLLGKIAIMTVSK